jgi:hypothetical protein
MQIALKGVYADAALAAAEELGIDFEFVLPEAEGYATARGAELIGMKWVDGQLVPNPRAEWAISETTRERANKLVQDAIKEGWSIDEFASHLEESGLFSDERRTLIARNEIALAQSGGKIAAWRERGDVEYVVLYDEDGCGEEVCDVDGDMVSIDEYEAEPLGHPSCTRAARPATQSELIEEGYVDAPDDVQSEEAA